VVIYNNTTNQKRVFCDEHRIIKRGLRKNSLLQLQIY
jgi:hypothetical protein